MLPPRLSATLSARLSARLSGTLCLALVMAMMAGCNSGGGGAGSTAADKEEGTTPTTRPAPAGDAFYVPPDDLDLEPGALVWATPVEAPPAGTRGWRILYGSESLGGDPIAVSGLLFVPDPPPAPGRRPMPVLALAHGTTGLGDQCAPSRVVAGGGPSEAHSLPPEVLEDHVVVATDYEGLGTPGVHPFTARDAGALVKADPATTAPFADRLEENSPGARRSKVPVFVYHGGADELIPAVVSKLVLDRYCANGTTATRKTYAGEGHGSVVAKAAPDVTGYLSDRLSGKPAPSSC